MRLLYFIFSLTLSGIGIGIFAGLGMLVKNMGDFLVVKYFASPIGEQMTNFFVTIKSMFLSLVGTPIDSDYEEYAEA